MGKKPPCQGLPPFPILDSFKAGPKEKADALFLGCVIENG